MRKRNEKRRRIKNDIFGTPVRRFGINSKAKGDANERIVCKILSDWCLGEEFVRVPRSGGMRWKNAENVCGDVIPTNRNSFNFIFSVETKHLQDINLIGFLRDNSKVAKIWQQAKYDAERSGKLPMLMLRENGMPKGQYIIFFDLSLGDLLLDKLLMQHVTHVKGDNFTLLGYDSNILFSENYFTLYEIMRNDIKFYKHFKL